MTKTKSLPRYDCYGKDELGHDYTALCRPDADGEWVRYDEAHAEIERLTRERDGLRAALIDISIAESIGRAQRIAILATTEPAQVEPRGDNPATTEARQIKQMEAIIESQPAASTSEHGTARSDQIGNFCRRHPAALYIRKYGCPSCDQKLPPYLLPVSRS